MEETRILTDFEKTDDRTTRLIVEYVLSRKNAHLLAAFDRSLRPYDPDREILLGKITTLELSIEMLLWEQEFYLKKSEWKINEFHSFGTRPLFTLFSETMIFNRKAHAVLNALYEKRFPRYEGDGQWFEPRRGGKLILTKIPRREIPAVTIGDVKRGFPMLPDA